MTVVSRSMTCTLLLLMVWVLIWMRMAGSSPDRSSEAAAGARAEMPVSGLGKKETDAIASCVHALEFRPSGIRGWKEAQVTMGGVSMDEINEETSESKLVPGLYITGELADRDFMCGGFNLSNAWLTGLAAAADIAAK